MKADGLRRSLRAAARVLDLPGPRRIVGGVAAARHHGLALVYHEVIPEPPSGDEVVPTVSTATLREHVDALRALGTIVHLEELTVRDGGRRPRFALTFDDDYASHAEHVLPLLESLGVPATFFVGGRALHGLGRYWWQELAGQVRQRGPAAVGHDLGLAASSVEELAAVVSRRPDIQARLEHGAGAAEILTVSQLGALAAGMTIGFHTLGHQRLAGLGADVLDTAVGTGRGELEALVGPVSLFAYPYGVADAASAAAVRQAGYSMAFTGAPGPVRPTHDRFRLRRWEPGRISGDRLASRATRWLLAPSFGGA